MTPFAGHLASRKLLHMDVLSSIAMGLAIKMKNRPNPIHRSELWSHRQEVLDAAPIFAESEATESCGSPGRYFKDHLELSMANENVTEKRPPQSVGFVPERLLQTDEAAAIIQIHPKTLQRFAREGVIRGIHIGKLWRFRASEIEEWIQRQTA